MSILKIFMILIFYSLEVNALQCTSLLNPIFKVSIEDQDKTFSHLPEIGSDEFNKMVKILKNQFSKNENSYALLDLRPLLSEKLGIQWYDSMPNHVSSNFLEGKFYSKNSSNKYDSKTPLPWHLEGLNNLNHFLNALFSKATERDRSSGENYIRLSSDKDPERNELPLWHIDGKSAVSISLIGPGTEFLGPVSSDLDIKKHSDKDGVFWKKFCKDCKPNILPPGVALFFMGAGYTKQEYGPPLIHRTPLDLDGQKRVLFLFRN